MMGTDFCGKKIGVFSVHLFLGNQAAVSRRRSGDQARPSESGDDGKLQHRPRRPSSSVHGSPSLLLALAVVSPFLFFFSGCFVNECRC